MQPFQLSGDPGQNMSIKNDEERFAHYAKKVWGVEGRRCGESRKEGFAGR